MRHPILAGLLLIVLTTPVLAVEDNAAAKTKVAQMAFLAQLAPKACPDFETDRNAVAAYMAGVQLNERELLENYAESTFLVAKAFMQSAQMNREAACNQVWDRLGGDGLGLITDKSDGE